jgi:hypothetical protein
MESSTAQQRDPVADIVKQVIQSRLIIVGLIAAAATIVVSWVLVFGLGLIPVDAIRGALGMKLLPGEPFAFGGRLIRALFVPWSAAVKVTVAGTWFSSTGVLLFPALIVSAVTVGVGLFVRQLVAPTVRSRLTVLVVAALAASLFVTICAAVLTYSVTISGGGGDPGVVLHFAHSAGGLFVSVLLITLIVGAFSYGVVGLLPKQFAGAARLGGLYVIVPTVIVGVLFPFAVAVRSVPNVSGGPSPFWSASRYSAGLASASVPLAFGAKATLDAQPEGGPFFAGYSTKHGNDKYRWAKLEKYMVKHGSARITGYAGVYGTGWKLVGVFLVLLVSAAWAHGVIRYVARLGAPRSTDGLRLGLLAGVAAAIAVYAVTGLAKWTETVSGSGQQSLVWGVNGSAATQAAALLVVVGGAAGLVYAAYRPSPLRYKPLDLGKLAGTPGATGSIAQRLEAVLPPESQQASEAPAVADAGAPIAEAVSSDASPVPPVAAPEAGETPAAPEPRILTQFCTACGTPFTDDAERFCGTCGAARER